MLSRRSFSGLGMAVAAAPVAGCMPLLLRVVLGRGMTARLLRGSRLRGHLAMMTAGRGMAVAGRAHRMDTLMRGIRQLNRIRRLIELLSEDGRVVARIDADGHALACNDAENSPLIRTGIKDDTTLEHYDLTGDACGFTIIEGPTRHAHYGVGRVFLGVDVFAGNDVLHYGPGSELIGRSRLVPGTQDTTRVVSDDETIRQFDEAMAQLAASWSPGNRERSRKLLETMDRCRTDPQHPDCDMMRFLERYAR